MAVKVIDKEEEGEMGIGLCRWIPFTQQAMIPLATKSIISIADLEPKMQIFYTNAVKEMVEVELVESKKKKSDISELLENLDDDNALLN
jgi:branched-subunit amino acid aminotransferase/4-amino-4-deoxychorismate lyase